MILNTENNPHWQCIFVCWGTKYPVSLINNLAQSISNQTVSCPRFVLITDANKPGLDTQIQVKYFPEFYTQASMKTSGCHAKIAMFEKGVLDTDLPAIYIDLDTVILGDVSQGLNYMTSQHTVAILPSAIIPFGPLGRYLYKSSQGKRYARGNSSMIVFHPAYNHYIADSFRTLYSQYPAFEFRPMIADERFISWVAQPHMAALPKTFVVKFPGEFMFYFTAWLYIKAKLPWLIKRRQQLVAITLNGVQIKPEDLISFKDNHVLTDNKNRILVWSKHTMGGAKDRILNFYSFLRQSS